MLESFDLTWTYGDERLVVTSKEKADEILTTRVYPVADLLNAYETRGLRAAKGAISYQWGPLMNMITSTIQPDAWDDNGGPGSISPFVPAASLVISQKRDVHEEIVELFVQFAARGTQRPVCRQLNLAQPRHDPALPVTQLGGGGSDNLAVKSRRCLCRQPTRNVDRRQPLRRSLPGARQPHRRSRRLRKSSAIARAQRHRGGAHRYRCS